MEKLLLQQLHLLVSYQRSHIGKVGTLSSHFAVVQHATIPYDRVFRLD